MKLKALILASGALIGMASPADAAVVTRSFTAVGSEFITAAFGSFAPVAIPFDSEFVASLTVTFDDELDATNQLGGVILDSGNVVSGVPLGYSYVRATDRLTLGSILEVDPSLTITQRIDALPNGFSVRIDDATGAAPTLDFFQQYRPGGLFSALDHELSSFSALQVVPPGVPEPATWAMMLLGFGLIGAGMRQRKITLAYG